MIFNVLAFRQADLRYQAAGISKKMESSKMYVGNEEESTVLQGDL